MGREKMGEGYGKSYIKNCQLKRAKPREVCTLYTDDGNSKR
jgi:hypothetical protein